MIRIFVLISLIFSVVTIAKPQQPIAAEIQPLASKTLLLDITKVSDKRMVAVGQYGVIIYSNDGKSWQQAQVPLQSTITKVFFLTEQQGWAVGHDASILVTLDGGETWQLQQYKPELQKPLFDIYFKNQQQGIAIGAYGLFFRTEDGGKTWQEQFHAEFLTLDDQDYLNELKQEDMAAYEDEKRSILPHFNRLFADGSTLFLVGEIGTIAKSNDFGQTWQKFDEIYQGSFCDITRTANSKLVVAGLRGHVFSSKDNGQSWQMEPTHTTALLNDIVAMDDGRYAIVGNGGTVLVSQQDSLNYRLLTQPDGKAITAGVWFNQQLVVASEVGIKIISVN